MSGPGLGAERRLHAQPGHRARPTLDRCGPEGIRRGCGRPRPGPGLRHPGGGIPARRRRAPRRRSRRLPRPQPAPGLRADDRLGPGWPTLRPGWPRHQLHRSHRRVGGDGPTGRAPAGRSTSSATSAAERCAGDGRARRPARGAGSGRGQVVEANVLDVDHDRSWVWCTGCGPREVAGSPRHEPPRHRLPLLRRLRPAPTVGGRPSARSRSGSSASRSTYSGSRRSPLAAITRTVPLARPRQALTAVFATRPRTTGPPPSRTSRPASPPSSTSTKRDATHTPRRARPTRTCRATAYPQPAVAPRFSRSDTPVPGPVLVLASTRARCSASGLRRLTTSPKPSRPPAL